MQAQGYDGKKAVFLAAVCGQTYTQYDNPDGTFVLPANYKMVIALKGRSFDGSREWFGFVLESADDAIVAFRGTSSTSDWVSDAMATQARFKCVRDGGLVHFGFNGIYESMRDEVLAAVRKISASKRLYITGHSLGGALATLCALDVSANTRFRAPNVYTFGSPRVGDASFAGSYGARIGAGYRINNPYDAVTHIPPFVFKLPKQQETYYYTHTRRSVSLPFQRGSFSANHILGSYYGELAQREPTYAERMCKANPGLCPGSA
ncbi:lipase family protein [Cohnella sp. REN36]|uniref:lipase family protein n=1 Tax=Cohnella sp. REN36 TaxID=2887347 RepID=UPI001D145715|nr:lipase family protein [Cohnella sp. REN36]MCC3375470.1 lipase family protein [Cohnella sp. REN36]